ncbi:MAG TPA: hypothetical protein VK190_03355 [Pseudoneobacillus sp.]|jgi:hypothetical protein|nr:hypothetical protein [Pseudoneobacillus sp.]
MSQNNIMLRTIKEIDTKLQLAKNFTAVKGSNEDVSETIRLMDNIYCNMAAASYNYSRAEDEQYHILMTANLGLFELYKGYFKTCFAYLSVALDDISLKVDNEPTDLVDALLKGGDKDAKTKFYVSNK